MLVEIGMYHTGTGRKFVRVTDDANGNILEKIRVVMESYKLGYKIGFKLEKYKYNYNGTECNQEGYASGIGRKTYLLILSFNLTLIWSTYYFR